VGRVGDKGLVLVPGEARSIGLGGFDVLVHADADDTGGAFSLIETREDQAGLGPPLHIHRDAAESFYVIDGEYTMLIDGRDFECPAGSFIYIPVGVPHTFVSGRQGSRKLNLYTPSAMVGYFDELAAAIKEGVDEAGLTAIAGRYSMDVVGAVPKRYL
jgi:mannose-6-phosphate isomerase-like protein (cupin superfamily)